MQVRHLSTESLEYYFKTMVKKLITTQMLHNWKELGNAGGKMNNTNFMFSLQAIAIYKITSAF